MPPLVEGLEEVIERLSRGRIISGFDPPVVGKMLPMPHHHRKGRQSSGNVERVKTDRPRGFFHETGKLSIWVLHSQLRFTQPHVAPNANGAAAIAREDSRDKNLHSRFAGDRASLRMLEKKEIVNLIIRNINFPINIQQAQPSDF